MSPPANSPGNSIPAIYQLFAALASAVQPDEQSGLGGKLLYAGEITPRSRSLLYAANIVGTASLAASPDPAIQREAIRDGVVDFLVTSLEEALRILKNEIRKRQTVSVVVATSAETLTAQMLDRGVLPDLLPSGEADQYQDQAAKFLAQGARQIGNPNPAQGEFQAHAEFVTWSVDSNFARWLPRLDACAQAVIPPDDLLRQRWLRLAPRYLGRLAQKKHGVVLTSQEKARFEAEVEQLLALSSQSEGTVKGVISGENSTSSDV
jgi:Urocanase Rossmann-like domain